MKTQPLSPGDEHDAGAAAAAAHHHHHRYQKIEGKFKPSPVLGITGSTTVMTVKNSNNNNNNNSLDAQDLDQFEIQLEQQQLDHVPSPPSNPSSPGRPSPSEGRNTNNDDDDDERLNFSNSNSSSLYAPPIVAMGPSSSSAPVTATASSIALRRQDTPQSPSSPSTKKIAAVSVETSPQTTPASSLTSSSSPSSSFKTLKNLPPLFLYIETGDFNRAAERAKRHPREVKSCVDLHNLTNSNGNQKKTKRLALHQACFKLRQTGSSSLTSKYSAEDPFIGCCRLIILLVQLYPDAAGMRETRHGCLPLHLAAFASCTQPSSSSSQQGASTSPKNYSPPSAFPIIDEERRVSGPAAGNIVDGVDMITTSAAATSMLDRPAPISSRSHSETTTGSVQTTMTAAIAEESMTGKQSDFALKNKSQDRVSNFLSISSGHSPKSARIQQHHRVRNTQSVSMGSTNIFISEKREEWAVRVLDALLDAFPRAIRMDSEGGRLPLHTAAAGRATPRVVNTLVTAYPAATRQRNKDGYLPVSVAAHWGISHPNVVVTLLRAYPDATFGRNRWERTPLEEALCMAGENGRPHQCALVRALRKHPSYWTRPDSALFLTTTPRNQSRIVDVDETVDSMDDSIEDEDIFLDRGASQGPGRFFRRRGGDAPRDRGEGMSPVTNNLPALIQALSWEGVLQRLKLHPEEAKMSLVVPTKGGFKATADFYPLHFVCERRPPIEVVNALLELCPEAACKRTMPGGALPLHIACTWYADVNVIDAILAVDRTASRTLDELGNLPLHSACFSGTSTSVIESLLYAFPKGVLARNNQGSLAEDIASRLKHPNRVTVLGLLNLCREDVIAKRQQKHRRGRSDGVVAKVLNERFNEVNDPLAAGVEIAYSGSGDHEKELMW
eukprot:CAMPEP_0113504232 /NCGR_PEP_ID=MMETSP0014_2-20120614/34605_1 /TAXON_ID=2857 /ORGANISM="Nitzschia sp." /LENGTH=895 /DNA_ID=CAMNT_0000399327 /DNA_START=53 /DNA_END=2737 /DNA_ORIENTATION=- /assembly_acc=CAM_ASM_000159